MKIVLSGSAEYRIQLRLQKDALYDRLRVTPSLTPLDGPLCDFGVNSHGELLTAFAMRRMTSLREWVSTCSELEQPTQQVASLTIQLLEVATRAERVLLACLGRLASGASH